MASNDDGKILHRDPVVQRGFTQTENIVLTDTRLSVGARFLYTLLKMHAWQADNAFPGQARLGEIMGIKERMVRLYLAELYQYGHITKEQRGLTQTNRYYIEPLQQVYADCLSERQYITGQERQDIASQDRQPIADKEDSAVKKTQPNKREIAPAPVTGDIPRIEPIGANRDMGIAPGTPVNVRPDAPRKQPRPVPVPCPVDFTLTSEDKAWAQANVAPLYSQLAVYTRMFITHYTVGKGKDERDTNWRGRWQMWMFRQFTDFGTARASSPGGQPARPYTIVRGA